MEKEPHDMHRKASADQKIRIDDDELSQVKESSNQLRIMNKVGSFQPESLKAQKSPEVNRYADSGNQNRENASDGSFKSGAFKSQNSNISPQKQMIDIQNPVAISGNPFNNSPIEVGERDQQ